MGRSDALSEELQEQIVKAVKTGLSYKAVADLFGVSKSGVSHVMERYHKRGCVEIRYSTGRPVMTKTREDKNLVNNSKSQPGLNAVQVHVEMDKSYVDKMCRICLKTSDCLEPIFGYSFEGVPILDIIRKICHNLRFIPFENDTSMPNNLCPDCIDVLCNAHRLSEISIASEIQLQSMLSADGTSLIKPEYVDIGVFVKTERDDSIQELEEGTSEIKNEIIDDTEDFQNAQDSSDGSDEEAELKTKRTKPNTRSKASQGIRSKNHECPTCNKRFDKPSRLARHEKMHDPNKRPFACKEPDCYQRFLTDASLQRHQIMHSGITIKIQEDKTFECIICNKNFQLQEALSSHMKTHKDVMETMSFPCNLCDQTFNKLNDLTRHRRKHPENKSHKCLICSKMFSQGSHLIDHLNRHNNLRPHACNICNKTFQQSSTLKDHLVTHTTERSFLCSECGKSFNKACNLRQHVKIHTNSKDFACHLCPKKFGFKGTLKDHIKSHQGLKPHSCNICSSNFTCKSGLTKHIRTVHEGLKPFECEVCLRKFSNNEILKRHVRIHTGEKPYKCEFEGCDRAYAQSNDLHKHRKIHVGELMNKCTFCPEAFRLQSELREHYTVHYQNKDEMSSVEKKSTTTKRK